MRPVRAGQPGRSAFRDRSKAQRAPSLPAFASSSFAIPRTPPDAPKSSPRATLISARSFPLSSSPSFSISPDNCHVSFRTFLAPSLTCAGARSPFRPLALPCDCHHSTLSLPSCFVVDFFRHSGTADTRAAMSTSTVRSTALRAGGACVRCRKGMQSPSFSLKTKPGNADPSCRKDSMRVQ